MSKKHNADRLGADDAADGHTSIGAGLAGAQQDDHGIQEPSTATQPTPEAPNRIHASPQPPEHLQPRQAIDYDLGRNKELLAVTAAKAAFPGASFLIHGYNKAWLRPDMIAGVAVAAYLIPQVMAYSAIVNVPPVAGLWTALAAIVVYAVMGSSRVLSVGPESTIALMSAAAVAPLAGGDPNRALALAGGLCLVVAGWSLVARMLRAGVIADLLSQPLLVGYLAGSAVLMIVGQLGKLTGTKVRGESIVAQIQSFADVVHGAHPMTLVVSAGSLLLIFGIHATRRTWPAPLIAVILTTIACVVLHLESRGLAVVGHVPSGLPAPHLPTLSWNDMQPLIVAGLGVALVGYSDNMLTARAFPVPPNPGEQSRAARVDPQAELVALAGVHVAVGLFSGFPASSSGSRTALAVSSGARSQAYSLVAGGCVLAVLFAAGPLMASLPQASLGAVVVYAATKLVSFPELRRLWSFRRREFLLAVATMLGTIFIGVLYGVVVAIALSLLEMTQRLARPHEGVLGRVPGMPGMHDVADYPDAQTLPGCIFYRYDAPLFFGNVNDLRARVARVIHLDNKAYPHEPVHWFILNVEANVEVDITAADGLREMALDLRDQGIKLGLARVKLDLYEPLVRGGVIDVIGRDMLFATLPVAEEAYLTWATTNGEYAEPSPPENGASTRPPSHLPWEDPQATP